LIVVIAGRIYSWLLSIRGAALVILALAPSVASAAVDTATVTWHAPLGISVSLDTAVGSGTFVSSVYADDPYYASTLAIEPAWSFDDVLTLSMRAAVTYEWTSAVTACRDATGPRPAGAPARDCSDTGDPAGQRADLDDLDFTLAHSGFELPFGAQIYGQLGVALPISRASRAANNILTTALGVGVRRPIDDFITPSVRVNVAKYFSADDAPLADAGEGAIPIGRCRDPRRTSCLLLAGFVPSWRMTVDAALEAKLAYGFDASVSVGYHYTRRHGRAPDAFSSTAVDANGVLIIDGTSSGDSTSGNIELGFLPEDLGEQWRFAFGVSSSQPARTADGKSLRFPFFDFISPANNYSAWYLSVSWTP